jgi:hypothetical protein
VTCLADGAVDCVNDVDIVLAGGTAEIKQRNETTLLSTVAKFEFTCFCLCTATWIRGKGSILITYNYIYCIVVFMSKAASTHDG